MDLQNIWQFLLAPIDLYCERTDSSLWAEPFNLFSNAAFLLVAWRLYYLAGKVEKEPARKALVYLSIIAVMVATGSALFHSLPNPMTQLADALPIAVFVALCVYFYIKERADRQIPIQKSLTFCILFLLLGPVAGKLLGLAPYLSKGEFYLGLMPALVSLVVFEENKAKKLRILVATILFTFAFTARTLDVYICGNFPLGSHFVWHLCSAGVAYLMATVQAMGERKNGASVRA